MDLGSFCVARCHVAYLLPDRDHFDSRVNLKRPPNNRVIAPTWTNFVYDPAAGYDLNQQQQAKSNPLLHGAPLLVHMLNNRETGAGGII